MRRFPHLLLTLFFTITLVSANTFAVFASAGDDGHSMEVEVNGYHVTLDSQNEWKKGENTIVVTLTDDMGMPVQNADVEILITPTTDSHSESESAHNAGEQHDSMPGMDMGSDTSHESMPGMDMGESAEPIPAHDGEMAEPLMMMESHHGTYTVQTQLASSGEQNVQVMFHVNGEMLQADFVVEIVRTISKSLVLWGFVAVNVALIVSAGMLKKQTLPVKGL